MQCMDPTIKGGSCLKLLVVQLVHVQTFQCLMPGAKCNTEPIIVKISITADWNHAEVFDTLIFLWTTCTMIIVFMS